jgi:hypothetical protein
LRTEIACTDRREFRELHYRRRDFMEGFVRFLREGPISPLLAERAGRRRFKAGAVRRGQVPGQRGLPPLPF